ncbi:TetR/AcrR family transcriptional regulator [Microbacterium sp. GCS4]|uniref:TetR/AcrR family transcriptional regulator n=1 Tax=Microbacterium sp. GCS4 TaxID=1692239 RepID=UPI001F164B3D|nr:TetR/AcrR family transcriptional regulator [Microbacterium sp. GCS4]
MTRTDATRHLENRMPTPDRTSLPAIVAAGRAILEEHGPAGVTMQAVAARVGVRAPSLYKRVRDREALLVAVTQAVADELTERLERTDGGLAEIAVAYRGFAHDQPEGFRLLFTSSAPPEALRETARPVLRACEGLVGPDDALDAARLFTAWATGFLQMELSGAFRLGGDVDEAFDYATSRIIRALTP